MPEDLKTPPATPPNADQGTPNADDPTTHGSPMKMPEGWTDPMADIDALAGKKTADKKDDAKPTDSPPSDTKPETDTKPKDDDPTKTPDDQGSDKDTKPETKPDNDKTPDGMDDLPPSKNFTRSKPLREAYDRTRTELADLRKKYADLEKQVQDGDVVSGLTEELSTYKERVAQFEREQTLVDYQNSSEYKDKYVQPLTNMIDQATALMREVKIKTGENSEREGTKEDFMELVRMPLRQAAETANELFGPAAPTIMSIWQQVRTLHGQSKEAIKNAQENVDGILKKRAAEDAERKSYANKVFDAASKKIIARFPEIPSSLPKTR